MEQLAEKKIFSENTAELELAYLKIFQNIYILTTKHFDINGFKMPEYIQPNSVGLSAMHFQSLQKLFEQQKFVPSMKMIVFHFLSIMDKQGNMKILYTYKLGHKPNSMSISLYNSGFFRQDILDIVQEDISSK